MTQSRDITQRTLREMAKGLQEDQLTDKWWWVKRRLQRAKSGMEIVKSNMEEAKVGAPRS